jgi:hypothetical protein
VKERAYEEATRRLKEAANDYARELAPKQAQAFLGSVFHALAALPRPAAEPPALPARADGTPLPQTDSAFLDELVIGELVDPRWRDR